MFEGRVIAINIAAAASAPMESVASVRAVQGKGLEGDRYFSGIGMWSPKSGPHREVTLIEAEVIETLNRDGRVRIEPIDTRRNLVTSEVPLTHLVNKTFQVGEVVLRGIRLCEPCQHLVDLTDKRLLTGLVHRGGLNAQILTGGMIRVGDPIRMLANGN